MWLYASAAIALILGFLIGRLIGARRATGRAEAEHAKLVQLIDERTTQLQQANNHLQRLSYVDALTNIANRRHFEEILEVEWRRARRTKTWVALLMIDIDHFKSYNDAFGHRAGDNCLLRVAAVLDSAMQRAGDIVARYGGEEFAGILNGSDLAGGATVAERLRASVEALGIEHAAGGSSSVVTISIGVAAAVPSGALSPEALLAAADKALYDAKREGRNRVSSSSVGPPAPAL